MKASKLIAIVAALGGAGMVQARGESVAQIKQAIIRESIASYSGSCPCPYSVMRNGRSCGGRSAYSRPGGESPICYASDITDAEVRAWRER